MANNGIVNVTTLKDVVPPCPGDCTPLGHVKDNVIGDPDYIAPYMDTVKCAITYDDTCPTFTASGLTGAAQFEMFVLNSVLLNPGIKGIRIIATHSISGEQYNTPFNFPLENGNFQEEQITLIAGSYTFSGEYYDFSDVTVTTCSSLDTITVS